jgi:hypothetical protein
VHGNACKPVPDASKQTLKLEANRLGKRYRFLVTAHTTSGTGSALSKATSLVAR